MEIVPNLLAAGRRVLIWRDYRLQDAEHSPLGMEKHCGSGAGAGGVWFWGLQDVDWATVRLVANPGCYRLPSS